MRITVNRFANNGDATLSIVFVDGVAICFGLEDEPREVKVKHETRIPAGHYDIGVRTHGGFNARYLTKFPGVHVGMLEIMDVPGFTDILIHVGNYEHNTSGCLLVGKAAQIETDGKMWVPQSAKAYTRLYEMVISAAVLGSLSIEINDHDEVGV